MTLTRSPMKRTRPKPAVPAEIRELLRARSSGWCEARLPGCTGEATDACHRISRKAGGRQERKHDQLSNLWHGCRTCHAWATRSPNEAYDLGLALKEHQRPAEEPVAFWMGWVLLGDDGSVSSV